MDLKKNLKNWDFPQLYHTSSKEYSLVAQWHSSANIGDQVWSLGQEDDLEKEMATHSYILAWEIPWTEEPEGLQFTGSRESDMT